MAQARQKITREFLQKNLLVFCPKNDDDSTFIQEELFSLGFKWNDGTTNIKSVTYRNILLENGMMFNIDKNNSYYAERAMFLDTDDLRYGITPLSLLKGDQLVREAFNQLSRQIAELKAENTALREEVDNIKKPVIIDKPKLN